MALSPMMKHYNSIKKLYPDTIVFYRLGDFYEMFSDDAVKASSLLDLTLTKKSCGDGNFAPMCGVPAKAIQTYLSKLIKNGEKVAICEQLSDPKPGQIVDRDIVRVVTPGTIIEDELLDNSKNNFILSISYKNKEYGLCWVDITTGEFVVFCTDDINEMYNKVALVDASEIIIEPDDFDSISRYLKEKNIVSTFTVADEIDKNFAIEINKNKFLNDFKNYLKNDVSIFASAILLNYLNQTQKRILQNVYKIKVLGDNYLMLDNVARKNLELLNNLRDSGKKGSLLSVLDFTKTSMGARLLRKNIEMPLYNLKEIENRQNGVKELIDDLICREKIKETLSQIRDCERICGKIAYNCLTPRDAENLCISLKNIDIIKEIISKFNSNILKQINLNIIDFSQIVTILENAIVPNAPVSVKDGGFIKSGFNDELDKLKNIESTSDEWVKDYELKEREATGVKTLKVGYNRVFGYYIEVPLSQKESVQMRYIAKQTLANNERFTTQELMELEKYVLSAKDNALKIEKEIFNQINELLNDNLHSIQVASEAIALLDMLNSFAFVSAKNNYCRPKMTDKNKVINIVGGRHPVVENLLRDELFVANDCLLDNNENRTLIITGPNMAGKSTYMRQVALIVIMAQMGCYVSAKSAEIGLVDRIFTRIGASDDLSTGQSTFMVEMSEVANIMNNATPNSLILLDEIGRGTSTLDGLSIAWAVVEYLSKNFESKTLFSTHFHELTEMEGKLLGVKNYRISVKEYNGKIIFLRKIIRGGANKSFGIEVSALAGLPEIVISRAKVIQRKIEHNEINFLNIDQTEKDATAPMIKTNESEVLNMIKEIDIEKISPMEAFMILTDICQKTKG